MAKGPESYRPNKPINCGSLDANETTVGASLKNRVFDLKKREAEIIVLSKQGDGTALLEALELSAFRALLPQSKRPLK